MSRCAGVRRVPAAALLAAVTLATAMSVLPVAALADGVASYEDFARRVRLAQEEAAGRTELVETAADADELVEDVSALLPGTEVVEFQGQEIEVDDSVLHAHLARLDSARTAEARAEAAADIAEHLASLRQAVGEESAEAAPSDPEALARLSQGDARPSAIRELIDRVVEWFRSLFGSMDLQPGPGGLTFARVVLWAIGIGLALLLAWVVLRWWRSRRERKEVADDDAAGAAEPVVAAAKGLPEDAAEYAERMARAGDYREAVRALFGDAARTLVRHGLVRQAKTLTNAELLAQVAPRRPAVLAALRPLSDGFEVAWYGHHDPGPEGFERARAMHREVSGLVRGGAA